LNILFLHPTFPGQFHYLMERLAADPANRVVHCSRRSSLASVPGVKKITYQVPGVAEGCHPFLKRADEAVREGLVVARLVEDLVRQGFRPDVIYGYAGFGPLMFLKDILPRTPLIGYFEWYVRFEGGEYDFDSAYALTPDQRKAVRLQNAAMHLDLETCDAGLTPTNWQHSRFPEAYRPKISVIHDGVDTARFAGLPSWGGAKSLKGIVFPEDAEIVTYLSRGFEPFRGFGQFMAAAARLQHARPRCHIVVVGGDGVYYSRQPSEGKTYRQIALESHCFDPRRLHFVGWLNGDDYLRMLRLSSVHVYLTRPYVLSWSILEAMAAGCLVVGSRTPPVEEVITHRENGLLSDFFDTEALAATLAEALEDRKVMAALRENARRTVVERYAFDAVLPRHLELLATTARSA